MLIFFWIIILGATLIKRPRIFPIVVTAFLVKLNYNAVNVADFNAYSSIYNQISATQLYQTGYGWYILNNLGRILGLDYNLYKVCSITICMIILWIVSKTMVGESSNLIFGLYLLYPALLDAIQLRFFTAMTMVLMGILFLSKQKVWSTIVYVLIVLLAASVHTSVLFYLLFAAYPIISKHREKLKYIVVASAIILMAFKSKLYNLIAFISNDRQMQYLDKSTGVTSGSGYIPVVTIASIFLLYLINHQIFQEISEDISFSETDKKNSEMISGISLMMFFMIPLVMLSGEFFRAFRIMFVLTYISLAILVRNNKEYYFKHISYSDNKIQFDPRVLGLIIAALGFVVNIIHLAPDAFASFF
jgi:hypothetical protein